MNTSIAAISSRKKEALTVMLGALATAVILAFSHGGGFAYATDADSSATGSSAGGTTATVNTANGVTLQGADHYQPLSSDKEKNVIDVMYVNAAEGTHVYIDVMKGDKLIIKRYAWTLDDDTAVSTNSGAVAGLLQMGFSADILDPKASVEDISQQLEDLRIFAHTPNSRSAAQEFQLRPVYAELHDVNGDVVGTELIGIRSIACENGALVTSDKERSFQADATYYSDITEATYELVEDSLQLSENGMLTFAYKEVSATDDAIIKGSVTYMMYQADGIEQVLKTQDIVFASDAAAGDAVQVDVPSVIAIPSDDGTETSLYRTISQSHTLTAIYPGAIHFTVACVPMGTQTSDGGQIYLARINYVDETGVILMTDSLVVDKPYAYTVPRTFSQRVNDQVAVYALADGQDQILCFDGSQEGVENNTCTVMVHYQRQDTSYTQIWSLIMLAAGGPTSQSTTLPIIDTQSIQVTKGAAAQVVSLASSLPYNSIQYEPYGETQREYSYEATSNPVDVAYYVPAGTVPEEDYKITVQYVNIANDQVLDSYKLDVTSDMQDDLEITPGPNTITADGNSYVLLDGQQVVYRHNYWTPYRTYTFYYRDVNDAQYANTVVKQTVIIDDGTTTAGVNGGSMQSSGSNGSGGTTAGSGAQGATGNTTMASLDAGSQLAAVTDAEGVEEGALLATDGTDTATERVIAENENPLSAGDGEAANNTDASAEAKDDGSAVIAVGVGIAAVIVTGAAAYLLWRSRKRKDSESAAV